MDQRWFSAGPTPTISAPAAYPDRCRRTVREPHTQPVPEMMLYGGVISLDAAAVAFNSTFPSINSQRPSRACTLFATATWVCRSGSPARESRWMNAAATRPVTLTCPDPFLPCRVNKAWRSMKLSASRTAARCARSICAATSGSATAHNVSTDLTGEKVRS